MRRKFLACAAAAAFTAFAASAAAQVLQRYDTGQWVVEANASGGSFSNCTATGSYGGGAQVMFMLTNRGKWGMGITNPRWNWRPDSKGPVTYWIDGWQQRRATATATNSTRLIMMLEDSTQLYEEIRAGLKMYIRPDGNDSFSVTLNGTSVALNELMACVRKYR